MHLKGINLIMGGKFVKEMQLTCEMVVFLGLVWLQQQHCPYHRTSLLCFLAVSQTGPERVVPLYRTIIFKHIQRQIRIAATFISSIKNMTMLNNSGVLFPAFLHVIKDITTNCIIKENLHHWISELQTVHLGVSLNLMFNFSIEYFCNPTGPIFTWKTKNKKNIYLLLIIN